MFSLAYINITNRKRSDGHLKNIVPYPSDGGGPCFAFGLSVILRSVKLHDRVGRKVLVDRRGHADILSLDCPLVMTALTAEKDLPAKGMLLSGHGLLAEAIQGWASEEWLAYGLS
jgi:hypothetical protein